MSTLGAFTPKPEIIPPAIPILVKGAKLTILITIFGVGLGFVIGIIFGLARISKNSIIYTIATWYVEFIRGTPFLVQLLFIYFGLGMIINITGLMAAIAGISVNSGAYIAEDIFSGHALYYLAPGVQKNNSSPWQPVYYKPKGHFPLLGNRGSRTYKARICHNRYKLQGL